MRELRQLFAALVLCLFVPTVSRAEPPVRYERQETNSRPKIAVADFRGSDPELSRFLAETVISELAASSALNPLDRSTVRRALTAESEEAATDPTLDELRKVGKKLRSAYFLTGSYLVQDEKIVLLAHLHDLNDDEAPGLRITFTGDRADLLTVVARLADQIKEKLAIREEPVRPAPIRQAPQVIERPVVVTPPDELASLRRAGFCSSDTTPATVLTEGDLARLLGRLGENALVHPAFSLPHSAIPAPRMLALTGLVKLMLTPEQITDYRKSPPAEVPSDYVRLPLWGQPFLAAATDRGWWEAARPFRPTGTATWGFIAYLTRNMGLIEPLPAPRREIVRPRPVEEDNEVYTGLVVDAHDLSIDRSQAPDVLDEDGNHLYPYEKHAPDADFINANGMVDYNYDLVDQTRAGKHPLVVQALRVSGGFHDDLIISNEDAERVRKAHKRSKFLWDWKVVFLIPRN